MRLSPLSLIISSVLISANAYGAEILENQDDSMEHIEVYGHKLTIENRNVAASVSALSQEAIARSQEAELSNILRELPGVDISGSVAPLSGQPAIRGLDGERIHVSIDNIKRKIESDGGANVTSINSLGIDPSQLKQVQVLRGPDSLTVGSGALGGSIRLVTKDAADYLVGEDKFGARAQVLHQSVSDSNQISVSLFGLTDLTDTVFHASYVDFSDVDVVAKDNTSDEDSAVAKLNKIKNDSNRVNFALKNAWYIDNAQTLKTKIDWSETESSDQPYGQRQSYGVRYPHLFEDYQNDYLEVSSTYIYSPDSPLIDLDVQFVYSDKDYQEVSKGFIEFGNGAQRIFDTVSDGSTERKSIRISNLAEFESPVAHKLAFELNYEDEEFEQSEVNRGEASTYYGLSESENISLSIIDQIELLDERLYVTAGVRYDDYERSNNIFNDYDNNNDGELSSELGVSFAVTEFFNIYLKYAEAFRAPSVQELYKKDEWRCHIGGKICYQEPQPELKPETSENYEAGFGLFWEEKSWADAFSLKAIYFDNRITDFIRNVPFMYYIDENGNKVAGSPGPQPANGVPVATHRDYSAKNIGRLDSEGVELELAYRLNKFDAYLGYSKITMNAYGSPNFFLGTVDDDRQPYVDAPADKITANVNYQLMESLNIGAQYIHYAEQKRLPEQYLNAGYGTESAGIVNLNLSFQGQGMISGLALRLSVDNVTDKRYLRAPASESNDPAELGRNYKATLSYQF